MVFDTGRARGRTNELSEQTDDELIIRIRKGEPRSLDVLIQRYEKRLFSFLFRMVGRSSDAEDLTQDVFVRTFKSLSKYQARNTFGAWIFTIARNVCKTHLMKNFRDNRLVFSNTLLEECASPERDAPLEADDEIHSMVSFLPEEYRRVILLKYASNLSCSEIAQIEELSEAAVKQRLHRARILIRENQNVE